MAVEVSRINGMWSIGSEVISNAVSSFSEVAETISHDMLRIKRILTLPFALF